jgi:hypothetical protein
MVIFRNCLPFWSKECHPMYKICKTFSCWSLNCPFSLLFRSLDKLNGYCIKWSLTVNIVKTKIIVFNKFGKVLKDTFYYDNDVLINYNEHKYLGVIFNPSLQESTKSYFHRTRKMLFQIRWIYPISIDALKLAIWFWYHVINTTNESLVHKAYQANLALQNGAASKIKQLFRKIGFNHVWEDQY